MQEPPPVITLLAQLKSFEANVAGVLTIPDVDWKGSSGDDEWSLTEVACHLRDVEREVHQPRFKSLMAGDGAFLAGAVADSWVDERRYQEQDGEAALADFITARQETLAFLERIDSTLWQRQGQHAFFGPTSMHELLYLMVQHDQAHWEQIRALLGL